MTETRCEALEVTTKQAQLSLAMANRSASRASLRMSLMVTVLPLLCHGRMMMCVVYLFKPLFHLPARGGESPRAPPRHSHATLSTTTSSSSMVGSQPQSLFNRRSSETSDASTSRRLAALGGDVTTLASMGEAELLDLIALHQSALVASQGMLHHQNHCYDCAYALSSADPPAILA
jgi:hypothetical protein